MLPRQIHAPRCSCQAVKANRLQGPTALPSEFPSCGKLILAQPGTNRSWAAAAPMHLQGGASSIDDALAPSAPPPALEIESLEMSDPESAPYPEMSETEVETELQNFDR